MSRRPMQDYTENTRQLQVELDNGWVDFSNKDNRFVLQQWDATNTPVKTVIRNQTYSIDLGRMMQTNGEYNTQRRLRFKPEKGFVSEQDQRERGYLVGKRERGSGRPAGRGAGRGDSQTSHLDESGIDCRYGEGCNNQYCPFSHRRWGDTNRRGLQEAPTSSARSRPDAERNVDCRYGEECNNRHCPFSHRRWGDMNRRGLQGNSHVKAPNDDMDQKYHPPTSSARPKPSSGISSTVADILARARHKSGGNPAHNPRPPAHKARPPGRGDDRAPIMPTYSPKAIMPSPQPSQTWDSSSDRFDQHNSAFSDPVSEYRGGGGGGGRGGGRGGGASGGRDYPTELDPFARQNRDQMALGIKRINSVIYDIDEESDKAPFNAEYLRIATIGMVGAGKSRLLCSLAGKAMFNVSDQPNACTSKTRVKECTLQVNGRPKCYLIDTPGSGHATDGSAEDAYKEETENIKNMIAVFTSINYIHTFIVVMNGCNPRVDRMAGQQFAFNDKCYGKEWRNNCIIVLTRWAMDPHAIARRGKDTEDARTRKVNTMLQERFGFERQIPVIFIENEGVCQQDFEHQRRALQKIHNHALRMKPILSELFKEHLCEQHALNEEAERLEAETEALEEELRTNEDLREDQQKQICDAHEQNKNLQAENKRIREEGPWKMLGRLGLALVTGGTSEIGAAIGTAINRGNGRKNPEFFSGGFLGT